MAVISVNFGLAHRPPNFDYDFDFDDLDDEIKEKLPENTAEILQMFSDEDLHFLRWQICWRQMARGKQLPPKEFEDMVKTVWLIRSGRGFGKTLTGANWLGGEACKFPSFYGVISPTHDDVRYTCFEGPTGLLSVLPSKLVVDRNQALPSITLWNGSIIRGFAGDTPERLRGPQHAKVWCDEIACLIAGTLVRTATGEVPIEQIRVGDLVQTRQGLKRVLAGGLSSPDADLWELAASDGSRLVGTGHHPVWSVATNEYVPLQAFEHGATLLQWQPSSHGAKNIGISSRGTTRTDVVCSITASTTSRCAGLFRRVSTFITKTVIRPTIEFVTSQLSLALNTSSWSHVVLLLGLTNNTPTHAKRNGAGESIGSLSVLSALPSTNPPDSVRSSVHRHAGILLDERDGELISVVSVRKLGLRGPVYNLDVEDAHEFYANGILTHNSWKYPQEAWDNIQFGLRLGDSPQLCVTGTPKPTPFIRKLQKDPRTIDVVGATYENRENLTKYFFESIAKYEGTRVGRQEIHGEVLDPEEEGFVQRSQWRVWAYDKPLPKFSFIVYSLDPAFTEKNYDKRKQTNDPTAVSVWGVFMIPRQNKAPLPHVMLLDAWEDWLGFPDLVKRVKKEKDYTYGDADEPILRPKIVAKQNRPKHQGRKSDAILIEEKASGISLRQQLAEENILTHGYNPGNDDKLTRLHYVSPMFAAGRVWAVESEINRGNFKSWADPLISQVCSYVGAGSIERDDLLDSATQGLRLLMDRFFGPFTLVDNTEDRERARAREIAERRVKKKSNPYD